jgi:hypothetical protein
MLTYAVWGEEDREGSTQARMDSNIFFSWDIVSFIGLSGGSFFYPVHVFQNKIKK